MAQLAPNYVSGNVIQHEDYDLLVSGSTTGAVNIQNPSIGTVWGTGYGRYGFGQDDLYLEPVQKGDLVRAQHWDNIDAALSAVIKHQGNNYNGLPGETIQAGRRISPIPAFDALIKQAFGDAGKIYATSDTPPYNTSYTGLWGDTGRRDLKFIQTLSFANADKARYFFNAGGKIKLSFSRTGGANKARNSDWSGLCAAAGTVEIGYRNTRKVPGSDGGYGGYSYGGYDNNNYTALDQNNGGFWANSPNLIKTHFRQNSSGYGQYSNAGNNGYTGDTADFIKVELRVYGNTGNNGGLGLVVEVTTTFENGATATPNSQDTISGTANTGLVLSYPGEDYLESNTWGTPSFNGVVSAV